VAFGKLGETFVEGDKGFARRRETDVKSIGEVHAGCVSIYGLGDRLGVLELKRIYLKRRRKQLVDGLTRDFHGPAHYPLTFKQDGRRYDESASGKQSFCDTSVF